MKKKNKRSTRIIIILSVIAVILLSGITAAVLGNALWGEIMDVEETSYIYIDEDDDIDSVESKIQAVAHPSTMLGFSTMKVFRNFSQNIRTGRYEVTSSTSMIDLYRNLRNHHQSPILLHVTASRTLPQLAGKLSKQLMADSTSLAIAMLDNALLKEYGKTIATSPSLFLPDSYEVYWDIKPKDLMKRMKYEYDSFWTEERIAAAKAQKLTPDEIYTLASIIDSETAYEPEKATVAGLYLNRLHKGMKLQSDPTVIFAIGDFSIRRVLNTHLAVESPYNTYRYTGLPPGPIRIASKSAIDAALHPAKHNYLYMCAKEDFSGSHNYAATFEEHKANARRYINALNARGIK